MFLDHIVLQVFHVLIFCRNHVNVCQEQAQEGCFFPLEEFAELIILQDDMSVDSGRHTEAP